MRFSLDIPNVPVSKFCSMKEHNGLSMRKVASWSGPNVSRRRRLSDCQSCNAEPETETTFTLKLVPRFLAKLSIAILAVAALIDLTSKSNKSYLLRASVPNRPALGSAAIKSVTEALSPILPFTGGIDLRKEDYWSSASPLETVQTVVGQVWEAFASSHHAPSRPSKVNLNESQPTPDQSGRPKIFHEAILSSSEGFISKHEIGQLTLEDVSQVINYAMESNKDAFDEQRFIARQSPRVRKVIQAVKNAVQKSRGRGVQLSRSGYGNRSNRASSPGSMDALMFCAVIRIFGEWRIIRLVPDGYKGYAVGMNLGYKDIVQNIAKVELAVHAWLDSDDAIMNGDHRSPTVAQILEYEFDQDVHQNLPRLKDRTAAMGLLWVRRQLQYQNLVYENTSDRSGRFPSTTDAVADAYNKVYNQYHGWAVQKIFTYSFQAAPEPEAIFRHMNPHRLKELSEGNVIPIKAKLGKKKIIEVAKQSEAEKETSPILSWFKNLEKALDNNPVLSWLKKICDESRKFVDVVREKMLPRRDDQQEIKTGDEATDENFITSEMTRDAKENIDAFLHIAKPLVADLGQVLDRLNMNDPTKV
ncbi:hypothetical protein ACA910_001729 [Epithemia clementina (nom. ined.)]